MKAEIMINTIEEFNKVRHLADMAAVPNYPRHNMDALKEDMYGKPNLLIEGRATMLLSFIKKVQEMGYKVTNIEGKR